LQRGIKGPQQFLLYSVWNCPDNASQDNRKHHNQRRIVASPDALLQGQWSLIGGRMKALKTLILFVTALAVTTAMVPQASSQTQPPAQQPPPAQPPPPEQPPPPPPPPAEEQHNSHPVAKGAAAGAAFGAASGNNSGTTVVHTGSANRSGSAHHQAKPHKTGKSRR
jgi:hypothetical protein